LNAIVLVLHLGFSVHFYVNQRTLNDSRESLSLPSWTPLLLLPPFQVSSMLFVEKLAHVKVIGIGGYTYMASRPFT
jgi:hypothetical protein